MEQLSGNTLIFTDLHIGLANNKVSRLNICIRVIKEIVDCIEKNNVKNVIFGGDLFHSRTNLDVNSINVAIKLVKAIAKRAKVLLVVGNHDAYLKNSTDINSLAMFKSMENVTVYDKAEEVSLNGQRCLLVPWLTDLSKFESNTFDMMVGHFEISSKYLIQAYVEENSKSARASSKVASEIDNDEMLSEDGNTSKSSSLVGNFVDLVKEDGIIYAGHIHTHKEFFAKHRKFIFVGSPYQQTLGDIDHECGWYLLDSSNKQKFIETSVAPKHIQIKMSEALNGTFDFKRVPGNIVQKIYDIDVKTKDEVTINQKINDLHPYEELLPDYQVEMKFSINSEDSESLELIKKNKLDYMKNYVDNIDQAALDEQKLDRDKIFNVLEDYYKRVSEV